MRRIFGMQSIAVRDGYRSVGSHVIKITTRQNAKLLEGPKAQRPAEG
jgi:hypothetical protein